MTFGGVVGVSEPASKSDTPGIFARRSFAAFKSLCCPWRRAILSLAICCCLVLSRIVSDSSCSAWVCTPAGIKACCEELRSLFTRCCSRALSARTPALCAQASLLRISSSMSSSFFSFSCIFSAAARALAFAIIESVSLSYASLACPAMMASAEKLANTDG